MVDFSTARQCWLAAYWSGQGLQASFETSADQATEDSKHLVLDALSDQDLSPSLAIYGSDRVLPVLVMPVYAWLAEALCAVLRDIGHYHQVPTTLLEMLQAQLLGDRPWSEPWRAVPSDDLAGEQFDAGLFKVEWDWLVYFWHRQGDSLAGFAQDLREIRQALPLGGGRLQGAKPGGASNLGSAVQSKSKGVATDDEVALRAISVRQLPAWHPGVAVSRLKLVQSLLQHLGDRWAES